MNDFLTNIDNYIGELCNIHTNVLNDLPCIVLYGNEEMYLYAYAKAMISSYYNKNLIINEYTHDDIVYKKSLYHFEMDYTLAHNDFIKMVLKNKNITGNRHIFVIKKFMRQQSLINLIDVNSNSTFIILIKNMNQIDPAIRSRSIFIRLPFTFEKTRKFLKNHYELDITREQYVQHSIISLIAEIKIPKYEIEFDKLIDIITTSRNQLDITKAIKTYCYNVFHVCIPLSQLCKLLIKKYISHKKIRDIVSICAEVEHNMIVGSRDILCYEQLFIKFWSVFKS